MLKEKNSEYDERTNEKMEELEGEESGRELERQELASVRVDSAEMCCKERQGEASP